MGLSLTRTAGTQGKSPLSLDLVKHHLRANDTDDTYLDLMVSGCIRWAENFTGRTLLESTLVLTLERFIPVVRLPGSPVSAVTSIAYVDSAGDSQTLAGSVYKLTTGSEPARITPDYNQQWPTTRNESEAVTITYTAGYGETLESAPEDIRYAVLCLCQWEYDEHRESKEAAERLLMPWKLGADAAAAGLDNQCALGIYHTA